MTSYINASFKGTVLKVDSIAVGINDATLLTLNMNDYSQYLRVGQQFTTAGNEYYNFIVDDNGVSINTSVSNRYNNFSSYALVVDGDVYVTGSLYSGGFIGCNVGSGSNLTSSNFWALGTNETENIYYPGFVTIGNNIASQSNTYSLNIVDAIQRNINNAQLSVANTKDANLRLAVLGNASNSPVIINSPSNVPIEFHAGRGQSYFQSVYSNITYYPSGAVYNGPSDTPLYISPQQAPHLVIDPNGNVGIHTNAGQTYSFPHRTTYNSNDTFTTYSEPMILHVNGAMYASNVLIWDSEANYPKSVDDLFVRRLGLTFTADQIIPGSFANGYYEFINSVGINTSANSSYSLSISGDTHVYGNIFVDDYVVSNNVDTSNLLVYGTSLLDDNVFANAELTVTNALRVKSGIFTQSVDSNGSNIWVAVQFNTVGSNLYSYSNIYTVGTGAATTGRFGVGLASNVSGINSFQNSLNHQLVVNKTDPSLSVYELQITDSSDLSQLKVAYIGHQASTDRPTDCSLIITTPDLTNQTYNRSGYNPTESSIYFYPSADLSVSNSLLSNSNLPTLNIAKSFVGINTYSPGYSLHVNGDIYFNGSQYTTDSLTNTTVPLGNWFLKNRLGTTGLSYINSSAPYVGINTNASSSYGLTVSGGIQSLNGYYTSGGSLIMPFTTNDNGITAYINNYVGIGVTIPTAALEVVDMYGNASRIRIDKNPNTPQSLIQLRGSHYDWCIQTDDTNTGLPSFSIYSATADTISTNNNMLYSSFNGTYYQTVIGSNTTILGSSPNSNATLTVVGDFAVTGNINIAGQYYMNGQVVINNNMINSAFSPTLQDSDIYIGGGSIYLQPGGVDGVTTDGVFINYTSTQNSIDITSGVNSPFRIYQPLTFGQSSELMRLTTTINSGIIQIITNGGGNYAFGVYNKRLSFLSGTNGVFNEIMSYSLLTNSTYGMGLGTFGSSALVAQLHIASSTGSNMLRVDTQLSTDIAGYSSELDLNKSINGANNVTWTLHGPELAYSQKLSFLYTDNSSYKNEMFTITNKGSIGIGTTKPQNRLHIFDVGSNAVLNIQSYTSNTVWASPQIYMLGGSNSYSNNSFYDYRHYSYSNNYYLESASITGGAKTLLQFDPNGNMIVNPAKNIYTTSNITQFNGSINVVDNIYLNGVQLFGSNTSYNNYLIQGSNIFLEAANSIVLNSNIQTGDLFHLFANSSSPNMTTYDSLSTNLEINMRTSTGCVYSYGSVKLYPTGNSFYIAYNYNDTNLKIGDITSSSGYNYALKISPYLTYNNKNFTTELTGVLSLEGIDISPIINFTSISSSSGYLNSSTISGDQYGSININGTGVVVKSAGDLIANSVANFNSNVTFAMNTTTVGNAYVHGNTITDSDIRLKENIELIDDALNKVCSLTGYTYNMKGRPNREIGLIAQEVREVFPEAVYEKDGVLGIAYANLLGGIVEAIKELKNCIKR